MIESADATGPVAFVASFPPDARFAATAAELAGRLASACGCEPGAADEVRGAVSAAFGQALALDPGGASVIDVALRTDDGAFEAEVACGGRTVLHCSKARSV
jgi:hypothetical protein